MSNYGNYFYKFKEEGYEEEAFIGLTYSIAEHGNIKDLKELVKTYQEYKKATATTVTKESNSL